MLDASRKDEFVSLFPANRKSGICNKILDKIRAGKDYSPEIARIILEQLQKYSDDNADIILILKNNILLFMDAIEYYLEYEKLSPAERQKLKQANSKEYIEQYMREQPITDKQIKMLEGLGYNGPFNISRLRASNIIEELIH